MDATGHVNSSGEASGETRSLDRIDLGRGLVVWQSPRLRAAGVLHAFTGRNGGCSTGSKATLDLAGRGSREGADLVAAERNLARLREALEVEANTRTLLLHQIHGADIKVDDGTPASWPPPRADILISDRPDALLTVRVADCVPVLIHDPRNRGVSAIHSGWRGTVADAPGTAVAAMTRLHGSRPEELIAAIGPAIGLDAFEVGPEVGEAFRAAGLAECVHQRDPKPHVDLFAAVRARLLAAGLRAEQIDGRPICSHANPEDCFSYRRDGPEGGRMAAVIQAPHAP